MPKSPAGGGIVRKVSKRVPSSSGSSLPSSLRTRRPPSATAGVSSSKTIVKIRNLSDRTNSEASEIDTADQRLFSHLAKYIRFSYAANACLLVRTCFRV